MSGHRADAVRKVLARWQQGNWRAGAELLAPDAVVSWQEPPSDLVECRGPAEVSQRLASFLDQWREFWIEPSEITELDDDSVLAVAKQVNIGKSSGARVERTTYIVWTFHGDRVTQIRWNWDRREALEAAGLEHYA
jgi:ketosteroid isomerase-like protein